METSQIRHVEEANCAVLRTRGAPATSTLCFRLCCSPQSSEVRPGSLLQLGPDLDANDNQSAFMSILFCQTSFGLFCFFAEELFSLGPEQLGCLQDKEKPGAKVSPCAEGYSQKCSLHICNMYGSCFFSEGQSDPTGITETVCQSAAGGPTERLHSQPH